MGTLLARRFGAILLFNVVISALGILPAEAHSRNGTMLDLGTLGGNASNAYGMNDFGQVVGQSETARVGRRPALFHAFLWTPGGRDGVKGNREMKDLGTLGGGASLANDTNHRGQIVGGAETADGGQYAALWNSNGASITNLGTLGGSFSIAQSINDYGQIVGISETENGSIHAFLWTPKIAGSRHGEMVDLGSLDGLDSYASQISNAGQVSGFLGTPVENPGEEPESFRGFLWTPHQVRGSEGTMIDIGTLGGSDTIVQGINRYGQITGASLTADDEAHGFLWTPEEVRGSEGTMRDIGTLGAPDSFATAINDFSQVAGDASIVLPRYKRFIYYPNEPAEPGTPYAHAFLWTPGGRDGMPGNRQMRDLGTLGGASSFTHAINNWGMVSGASNDASGTVHAFLWVP